MDAVAGGKLCHDCDLTEKQVQEIMNTRARAIAEKQAAAKDEAERKKKHEEAQAKPKVIHGDACARKNKTYRYKKKSAFISLIHSLYEKMTDTQS